MNMNDTVLSCNITTPLKILRVVNVWYSTHCVVVNEYD